MPPRVGGRALTEPHVGWSVDPMAHSRFHVRSWHRPQGAAKGLARSYGVHKMCDPARDDSPQSVVNRHRRTSSRARSVTLSSGAP